MPKRRSRAGFIVLAAVLLLVAMASGATAGGLITGKQIKNGTVTGADLRNGSVTGLDIRDGSLDRADLVGSFAGPQGPDGAPGPRGPVGPPGPPSVSGYEHRLGEVVLPKGDVADQVALCSPGKIVVGGGVSSTAPRSVRVVESAPLNDGTGWTATLLNESTNSVTAYVWAVCLVSP